MFSLNIPLNNTSFYPSIYNLQDSLTIQNASASSYTLIVMSYVSLITPFVIAYIDAINKTVNRNKGNVFNSIGYEFLQEKLINEAIIVFQENTRFLK